MQIENITVGVRSDGKVAITLAAPDGAGALAEVTFYMSPPLAELMADDLSAAAARARSRGPKESPAASTPADMGT